MDRFDLSDEEWSIIEPHFPKSGRGPARQDDRRILNGIFYFLRTGAPWRDLPERYGPRTTVYNRYSRWGQRGIWKGIFDALAKERKDSLIFIDSSIVKARPPRRLGQKGGTGGRYWTLTRRSHEQGSRGCR